MKFCKLYIFFIILFADYSFGQEKDKILHDLGIYNTIQWTAIETPNITPQVWVYIKNYYIEARYNYENLQTISLYVGRSFLFEKKTEIEITPMIGGVYGKTNGISPGFNFKLVYKRFSTFTQCQYTVDLKSTNDSFFWDWTGFNIEVCENIGLGGAVQILIPNTGEQLYNAGPMLRFQHKFFAIEGYVYNFWEQHPVWAIGLEYSFK